jgi:hypothetical protein
MRLTPMIPRPMIALTISDTGKRRDTLAVPPCPPPIAPSNLIGLAMLNFLTQVLRVALVVCVVIGNYAFSQDLASRERDLHESLMDLNALVEAGITRNDFKRALPPITIKYDRFVRSGGKKYGALYDAVKAFREADETWDARVESMTKAIDYDPESKYKIDQLTTKSLQRNFASAHAALDNYQEEQSKARAAAKQPARKSARTATPASTSASEFGAILEKYKADAERREAEHKAALRDLDARRACRYTNPPSCP